MTVYSWVWIQTQARQLRGEIADMALDLIAVTQSFVIPHRPQTMLKIRVGIHSGEHGDHYTMVSFRPFIHLVDICR